MRKTVIVFILLIALHHTGIPLTLKEAQELALKNNTELSGYRKEVLKRKIESRISLSKLLPQVNTELSLNITKEQSFLFPISPGLPPQNLIFVRDLYEKYTLLVSQDLLNPLSLQRYRISRRLEGIQRLALSEKEREVISKVRDTYIGALKLKALLQIYRRQKEMVLAHLKDVEAFYKEGLVAFKDILETKVKLQEVKDKEASTLSSYRRALLTLSYLTGTDVREVEELEDHLPHLEGEGLENLLRIALQRRALIKLFRERALLSEDNIKLAKASFYPIVSITGIYRYSRESNIFPNNLYHISLSLRWNLFSGMGKLYTLRLAEVSREAEQLKERDIIGKVRLSIASILEEINSLKERVKLSRMRIEEAEEHLRIAEEKYRAGLGTNTEVIDAQSYLVSARKSLEINRYELLRWRLRLLEEVGYER